MRRANFSWTAILLFVTTTDLKGFMYNSRPVTVSDRLFPLVVLLLTITDLALLD